VYYKRSFWTLKGWADIKGKFVDSMIQFRIEELKAMRPKKDIRFTI
jgi:hypothetical protein